MFTLTNDYYTKIFIGMCLLKDYCTFYKNYLIDSRIIHSMTKVSTPVAPIILRLIYYMIFWNFLHDNFFASDDHRDYVDVRNQH